MEIPSWGQFNPYLVDFGSEIREGQGASFLDKKSRAHAENGQDFLSRNDASSNPRNWIFCPEFTDRAPIIGVMLGEIIRIGETVLHSTMSLYKLKIVILYFGDIGAGHGQM